MPCFGIFGSSKSSTPSRPRSGSRTHEHGRSSRKYRDDRGRRPADRSGGSRYDQERQYTRSSGRKSGSRHNGDRRSRDTTRPNDQYYQSDHRETRRRMPSTDRRDVASSRRHTDPTYRRAKSPSGNRRSTVPSTHQPRHATRVGAQPSQRSSRPRTEPDIPSAAPMSTNPSPRTFEPDGEIFASPAGSTVVSDCVIDSGGGGDRIAVESVNTTLAKLPLDYWNKVMTQDERDLANATAFRDLRRVYGETPCLAGILQLDKETLKPLKKTAKLPSELVRVKFGCEDDPGSTDVFERRMISDDIKKSTLPFWRLTFQDIIEGDRRAGKWLAETGTGMSVLERYEATRATGSNGSMFYDRKYQESLQQANNEVKAIEGGMEIDASPEEVRAANEKMRDWRYQFGPEHLHPELRMDRSRRRSRKARQRSSKRTPQDFSAGRVL